MSEEKERPNQYFIPQNTGSNLNFMGMSMSWRKVIEGGVLGGAAALAVYYICEYFGVSTQTMLTILLLAFVIVGFAGFHGVNGQYLTAFILSFLKFQSRRRKAYFNPRVKTESKPTVSDLQKKDGELLSSDKFESFYKKYIDNRKQREKDQLENFENEIFSDSTPLYFSDDAGYVDKPLEYMTAFEKRKMDKKKKAEEKKRIREAKAAAKKNKQSAKGKTKPKQKPAAKKKTSKNTKKAKGGA